MSEELPILKNAVRCNHCQTTIESRYRHEFVRCKCEQDSMICVDGGHYYLKRSVGGNADYEDLSVANPNYVNDYEVERDSKRLSTDVFENEWNRNLCEKVSKYFGYSVEQLHDVSKRVTFLALARHVIMYTLKKRGIYSFREIAKTVSSKLEHTAAIYSRSRITNLLNKDNRMIYEAVEFALNEDRTFYHEKVPKNFDIEKVVQDRSRRRKNKKRVK